MSQDIGQKKLDLLLNKYKYDVKANNRQTSLDNAIIEYGPMALVGKLKSLPHYTNPDYKKIIDGDISWLKNRYKFQFEP